MRQHGTNFVATAAENPLYQTTGWSNPTPATFAPPVALHAGDPLHCSCSFTNNGTSPLTFSESSLTNEMCTFSAVFYPAPSGVVTVNASSCQQTQM